MPPLPRGVGASSLHYPNATNHVFLSHEFTYRFEGGIFGVAEHHEEDRFGADDRGSGGAGGLKREVAIREFAARYRVGGEEDV